MTSKEYCPVPKEQIPLQEFIEMSSSWFFTWPTKKQYGFYSRLLITWFLSTLFFIFIGTGSIYLRNNQIELVYTSLIYSLLIPALILIRLFLGWTYIYKRLISKVIIYEETDWHDGQKWMKPAKSHEKDSLIAKFEVIPIIKSIKILFVYIVLIMALGFTYLYYSFIF